MSNNVLIADSDLGFVFWLGQALDAAGYEALPAKGVKEALAVLTILHVHIDLLLIRFTLPGAEAFATDLLNRQRGQLKRVALIDESGGPMLDLPAWDAWRFKPRVPDEEAKREFIRLVQSVLPVRTAVPIVSG